MALPAEKKFTRMVQIVIERDRAGLCFECGVKIVSGEQVGRCWYARPCGHRQGQGTVPERYR